MKLTLLTIGITVFLAVFAGCGTRKLETNQESPSTAPVLSLDSTNLAELMKNYRSHVLDPQPWVGYWFPYGSGGISSAAMKYDSAYLSYLRSQGRDTANYESATNWELQNHGSGVPKLEPWFGHCNGWTASSLLVDEPRAPKMIEGIEFSVGDLKAMLAESYLEFSGDFVGTRVNDKGDFSSAAFWDTVPAQFHLLLANTMGKQNRGVIIDRHTGAEIWNQPLIAYEFEPIRPEDYLGPHPSAPDLYRVNVTARIWWGNDNVSADDISPTFNLAQMHDEFYDNFYPGRLLRYELWLDAPLEFDAEGNLEKSGNITVTQENGRYMGGTWKNGSSPAGLINSHPDYMWVPFGRAGSTGYKNPRVDDNWVKEFVGSSRPGLPD